MFRLSIGDDGERKEPEDQGDGDGREIAQIRRVRADAQRNIDTLLQAAMAVFATSGVDAPVREIAEKAGVGVGTIYRHFPQRSDLIAAVFRREIDACADAAPVLAAEHEPGEALAQMDAAIRGLHRGQARARQGAPLRKPGLRHLARVLQTAAGTRTSDASRVLRQLPARFAPISPPRSFWVRSRACACTLISRDPNTLRAWFLCWSTGYVTARARRSDTDGLDGVVRGTAGVGAGELTGDYVWRQTRGVERGNSGGYARFPSLAGDLPSSS